MGKKLLIIGGSYFAGRVFCMLTSREGYDLTLINRGTYSMTQYPGLKEYKCDRRDPEALGKLELEDHYDAVIDFCAYELEDIKNIFDNVNSSWDRYFYFSTADVYARTDTAESKTEDSPLGLVMTDTVDEVGLYAYKKMLLENELKDAVQGTSCSYTILRPAFMFGPYNYAPRESYFIQNIVQGKTVYCPTDATGQFQFVYVKDVKNALTLCLDNPKSENEIYNLSAPDIMTYEKFLDVLEEVSDIPFERTPITVREVIAQNIPLPFPLVEQEDELFDGSKITEQLGLEYSDFKEDMQLTWNAFKPVYEPR